MVVTPDCGSGRSGSIPGGGTMDIMDTKQFKQAFWYWFDNLPASERKKFYTYPADMAELYFYNKVFSKIISAEINNMHLEDGVHGAQTVLKTAPPKG